VHEDRRLSAQSLPGGTFAMTASARRVPATVRDTVTHVGRESREGSGSDAPQPDTPDQAQDPDRSMARFESAVALVGLGAAIALRLMPR